MAAFQIVPFSQVVGEDTNNGFAMVAVLTSRSCQRQCEMRAFQIPVCDIERTFLRMSLQPDNLSHLMFANYLRKNCINGREESK